MKKQIKIFKPAEIARPQLVKGGTDTEGIIINDETLG